MNQELWISTEELSFILGVSSRAVRKAIAKNKYKSRKVYKHYEILIPSLDEDIQQKIYEYKNKVRKFEEDIKYTEEEKKVALTKLDLVLRWRDFRSKYKGTKINSIRDFITVERIQNPGGTYGKITTVSPATMMRWDKKLKDSSNDWKSLLNKYVAHSTESCLSRKEQEIFLKLLLHPNQTNIGKAISLTKHILSEQGVTEFSCDMTYRRFARKYIKDHYDLWVLAREGEKALRDKVLPYIERDISLLKVGDVIIGDGHRLAFQVINPFTGKPCRPTLVAYQDWKSAAMLGFEIMLEENTQCIASALRNSIINLGKIPKYVYQDNGKAFKSQYFMETEGIAGLFLKLGITPINAQPYNAKAKPIERFFREMQDSFERLLPSFVGSCINNQPAYLKRNEKLHKKQHIDYIPTIEEVIDLLNKWLSFHYSQPCPHVENKSIGEVLIEGRGNGVNLAELDDLMMVTEIKNIGRNGIRFLKSDYYDESLYGLKEKVVIKYSLFDLSYIKVYSTNGKFICVATRLEPINPIANYEGTAKDINEFKERVKQKKALEKQTVQAYLSELKKEKVYIPSLEEIPDYDEYKSIEDKRLYVESLKDIDDENSLPVFHNRYERYDYLKKKDNLTPDERQWIANYEKSDEYKLIYGMEEEV